MIENFLPLKNIWINFTQPKRKIKWKIILFNYFKNVCLFIILIRWIYDISLTYLHLAGILL